MFPYIEIFGKMITSYAICVLLGILVMGFCCIKKAKAYQIQDYDMIVFLLICAVGVLLGGHLLYGIVNINLFIRFIAHLSRAKSIFMIFEALGIIFGGSVFYGGLLGGMLAGFLYAKKKKLDLRLYSYIITPFIPLFHFFGRIGCFLSGCCYGIESKIGFTYTHSLVELANGVNRFPVQLVEAGCNLILFLILLRLQKKGKCKETLLAIYLLSYATIRFVLEFLRGDTYRGFLFGLSTSQIISILLFGVSLIYLIVKKKKPQNKKA